MLTQKLNAAERKIDEYSRLIVSLSLELRRYQDIICHPCRENVIRVTLAIGQPHTTQPASQPIAAPRITLSKSSSTVAAPSVPAPVRITQALAEPYSIASSAAAHSHPSIHPPGNISSHSISAISGPDHQNTHSRSSTPSVSFYSSDTEVETFEQTKGAVGLDVNHPVEYNPGLKQTFNLRLVNNFALRKLVLCAKFSRDGKYLAVGLVNGQTHVYDVVTGSKSILTAWSRGVFYTDAAESDSNQIWAVQFSIDNRYLATGVAKGDMGEINIWEVDRKRIRAKFKHEGTASCLDLSPNGRFLVSALSGSVCVWSVRDGSRRNLFQDGSSMTWTAAFSADGQYVAAGSHNGFLRLWDARTFRLVVQCNIDKDDVKSLIFSSDGTRIMTGSSTVQCMDLTETRSGRSIMADDRWHNPMTRIFEFKGHSRGIDALSISSDNRWIVSGSSLADGVFILDARHGAWVCKLCADTARAVDFSPSGPYLAIGGYDGVVRLWKYETVE